jgi:hypothetical protein
VLKLPLSSGFFQGFKSLSGAVTEPGRGYAPAQAVKTTLFAAAGRARLAKKSLRAICQ